MLANDPQTGLLTLHAEDGRSYAFRSDGTLASVTSPLDDRNPAALVYTWTGTPARLRRIEDPVSRRGIDLIYGAPGSTDCPIAEGFTPAPHHMLCKVSYSEFGGGETKLYYSSDHLARIEDPGGEVTDLGYDSSGRLTRMRDPLTNDLIAAGAFEDSDDHKTMIEYGTDGKVARVKAPVPNASTPSEQRPEHSYAYPSGSTSVTVAGLGDGTKPARLVTSDAAGRTKDDIDFAGKVTSYEWDTGDRLLSKTEPNGTSDATRLKTTNFYDDAGRPAETYGPWLASEFSGNRAASAPLAKTFYDEGINGLASAWWDKAGFAGPPKKHSTFAGWSETDWGTTGSPDPSIPPDNFSGRLTGEINVLTAGEYRFSTEVDSDDGARVFVDDSLLFDRWDPYRLAVLDDGPRAYWRLGEAAGTTTARDASPNRIDGSYLAGVSLGAAGAPRDDPDTAASLDGVDDYVAVGSLGDPVFQNPFTVEAWVKFGGVNRGEDNAIVGHGTAATGKGLHIGERGGKAYFGFYFDDLAGTTDLTPGAWYHLAFVHDGKQQKIYVNGRLDNLRDSASYTGTGSNAEIGRYPWATNYNFRGSIDEVAVYPKALSDTRLYSHFLAGRARTRWDSYRLIVQDDGPVGYWRLADTALPTAQDSVGTLHGTYYGSPSLGQAGKIDPSGAVSFDGVNDYMLTPNLRDRFSNETLTLEVWFKPDGPGVIVTEQGQADLNNGWHDSQIEIADGGEVRARVWALPYLPLGVATWGVWHHAVLRYNKGTQTVDGFLDGVRSATTVRGDREAPWENAPRGLYYAVGAADSTNLGSGAWFKGAIDEFAVYSKALSDEQVEDRYRAGASKINALSAGAHRIRIDYQERTGPAKLRLLWTPPGPGGIADAVPISAFKPRYGLITTKADPDGKKVATEYQIPELGLPTASILDPAGLSLRSTTAYEAAGSGYFRRTSRTLRKGEATKVTYSYYPTVDDPSTPADERAADNPCTAELDPVLQGGMLKKVTSADPDGAGPQVPIVREFRYDSQGRTVARRVVGDAEWSCTAHDPRGRITSQSDSRGKKTTVTYRVSPLVKVFETATTFPDSSGTNQSTVSRVDWLGRSLSYVDEHGTATRTEYDRAGRVTATFRQFQGQGESKLTEQAYDPNTGRLSSITEYASGTPRTTSFEYDDGGKVTRIVRPNGVETVSAYDSKSGLLASISHKQGVTDLSTWNYTRYKSGDIASETTSGRSHSFEYDGVGRLAKVTENGAVRDYFYDANSNRCSTSGPCAPPDPGSCPSTADAYTYDCADRLLSSPFATGYTYDDHGNLVSAKPSNQSPAGSLNEAFSFDAAQSTSPREFPFVVGQPGDVSAQVAWSPSTYASGNPQGSIAAGGITTAPVQVAGQSQLSSSLAWSQGTRTQSDSLPGSVTAGGTSNKTISPTGSGPITASLDWQPLPTYASYDRSGSIAAGGSWSAPLVAKGESYLSASLSWSPDAGSHASLTLRLENPAGSVVKSATSSNGGPLTISYLAPDPGGGYTLEIVNNSPSRSVPSFSLPHSVTTVSTQPVTGTISPLQVWSKPLTADGQGHVSAGIAWTQGSRTQNESFPTASIGAGGASTHTISPEASGTITANLDWGALPVYTSASPSGSIPASGSWSAPITAKGSSYLSSSITWTKGSHDVSSAFSGTLGEKATASHTVTSTAPGGISARLDWSPARTSSTKSSYVSDLGTDHTSITASASGRIEATLTWPSTIRTSSCDEIQRQQCVYTNTPNPADLDLYLIDQSSGATVAKSDSVTGYTESVAYDVSGLSYSQRRSYILRVKAKGAGSQFTLSSAWPVTADLDLELYNSAGALVASTSSTSAKPESISAANQPPGTYTLKAISRDYSAPYRIDATYRVLDYASLTLRIKEPTGSVVKSASGAAGALDAYHLSAGPGGVYTVEVLNSSADLEVPSFTLPHSATTVSTTALSGSIVASGSISKVLAAEDQGVIGSDITWAKGSRPKTDTLPSSVAAGASSTHTIAPDAAGGISAELDWSGSTTSAIWNTSVATAGTVQRWITASSSGQISATLTWPSAIPNPDLDLYLYEADVRKLVASSTNLTGNSESLTYGVPAEVTYFNPKTYLFEVKAKATGSSFTLSATLPVTANLDLELWQGLSKVASSYSTTAKPERISAADQPAGTYTLKALSKDYSASYTLKPTYSVLAFADLTLRLKDASASVVKSARGASGELHLDYLAPPPGGSYTLEILNNSPDTAVPSFSGWVAAPQRHYANLDLQLLTSAGTTVAETASTVARPEGLTLADAAPGTYTLRVVSKDWEAAYNLSTSYRMPAFATLAMRLKDSSGATVKAADGSGGELALDYLAPTAGSYTLEIENKSTETAVPSFTGSAGTPKLRYSNLDLELWDPSGVKVAESSSASRPESLSHNAGPGTYTLKVVSRDFEADYFLAAGYPVVGYADLTLNLKDPSGQVVKTARSADGSASLSHLTPAGGAYTLEVVNNSAELPVPSYQISWSLESTMSLALKNPSGQVVAEDTSLGSPNSVSAANLPEGKYTLVPTPTGGVGTATVTASYPGRPARESIAYDGGDHATSIDDGTNRIEETLAPSGRVLRRVVKDPATGEVREAVIFGYEGEGDSPAYSRSTPGGAVTTYLSGPGGLLLIDTGGNALYPLANAHGDLVGTTDVAGAFTANPATDEFGAGAVPADRLGWLGAHRRFSVGGNLGLIRMGVRLYDPALGKFLQVDPIEGGSANDYDYGMADPINSYDLDGRICKRSRGGRIRRTGRWLNCRAADPGGWMLRGAARAAGSRGRACMPGVRCYRNTKWLLWADGFTWGHTVICRRACDPTLVKHEGIHVGQWERHGFTFPYRYGWELVTEGYGCQIRYEEAAYKGAGQACPG